MPVTRAYLKPRSVERPPQGDFSYLPVVKLHEADTAAGLEALMDTEFGVNSLATTELWVIESIEYQVAVLKPAVGMNPAQLSYSALIHATRAKKV